MRIAHVIRRITCEQGVAIGRGFCHIAIRHIAAAAGLVRDHDRLRQHFSQRIRHDARGAIDQATRRVGHDQHDGFTGEAALRKSKIGECEHSSAKHTALERVEQKKRAIHELSFGNEKASR